MPSLLRGGESYTSFQGHIMKIDTNMSRLSNPVEGSQRTRSDILFKRSKSFLVRHTRKDKTNNKIDMRCFIHFLVGSCQSFVDVPVSREVIEIAGVCRPERRRLLE